MIAGLEGEHSWNGGAIVLNRQGVWPFYDLDRIVGLGSLGDRDDVREPAYGRRGEIPRPTVRRGKTVAYEGTIRARTMVELAAARAALLDAFDATDEAQMSVLMPYAMENVVPNPRFELDTTEWGGAFSNAGVTMNRVETPADYSIPGGPLGANYANITTDGTVVHQGRSVRLPLAGLGLPVGTRVRALLRLTPNGGANGDINVGLSHLIAPTGQINVNFTPSGWGQSAVVDFVTAQANADVYFYARTASAQARTFAISLAFAWIGNANFSSYFDGDTPGARWRGVRHLSRSLLPGSDRTFMAGAQAVDVPDEQFNRQWERKFTVVLRNSDGRVFYPELVGPFDTPAPVDSDGVVLPLTPQYVIPAAVGWKATTAAFRNVGKAEADPILTLRGPVDNPVLVHDTQWRALRFPALAVPALQDLVVDFRDRSVKLNGVDVSGEIDHGLSDWWDDQVPGLVPGDNVCSVAGANMTANTNLGVSFYPADPA